MKTKKIARLIAILLTFAMMIPFASCDLFKTSGSLKLESIIVDPTSIETEYEVGEKVDFSNIKVLVKYNDATLNKTYTAGELTIGDLTGITATEGKKQVKISFKDPNLNVEQEVTVTITVTAKAPEQTTPEGGEIDNPPALPEVVEFLKPSALVAFDNKNKAAGTLEYGDNGFSGQFAIGEQIYVIGNQNEFKLTPGFAVWDENANNGDGDVVELKDGFFSNVVISIKTVLGEEEYFELTATAKENNIVEYYYGETLIATVNTYKGTYLFTAAAADHLVKIFVLPAEEKYVVEDVNPIVLIAKVINAYNVYEAWQLAVIDNVNAAWADIKAANGIADLTVSGIVLHNDIKLTAEDVPASFFNISTADAVYTNSLNQEETVTVPKGTKFLVDGTFIYERTGVEDFVIEGNFFNLDTKSFPLIASPAVFGKDAGKDYGVDFSNAALFKFNSVEWSTVELGTVPADVANVTVNNIALVGNAKRDNLIDATENLASAGGLIFMKASHYTKATLSNVIGNSYFITYFVDYGSEMYVNNAKCYDSYQNAAFVWSNSKLEMVDSYVNGCGGPVIIAMSVLNDNGHPTVTVTGGQLETHVSGEEIWFTAVNATTIVGQIKGLGFGLQQAGFGNFVDANGKMNVLGAITAEGSDAAQIVTGIAAQGSFNVDGDGINRFQTAENVNWMTILQISQYAAQSGQMPPFFTVTGADGVAYSIYYTGNNEVPFVDLQQRPLGTDASHAALAAAFMQADTITLTQGGLSVVFEFYHY